MYFKLKQFREAHGLYQSDIAELLQITQSSVSRMEIPPSTILSPEQVQILCDKFGRHDVDAFLSDTAVTNIAPRGNTNGSGIQNNGYIASDSAAMDIIVRQSESLARLTQKQIEVNDRLISLLDKLSQKL